MYNNYVINNNRQSALASIGITSEEDIVDGMESVNFYDVNSGEHIATGSIVVKIEYSIETYNPVLYVNSTGVEYADNDINLVKMFAYDWIFNTMIDLYRV